MENEPAEKGDKPGGSYRRAARRADRREARREARRENRRESRREARRDLSRRDSPPIVIRKPKPPVQAPLSLALHDWQRRDLVSSIAKGVNIDVLTETEYGNRLKKGLPKSYTEAGIVYRLPEWKIMNPAASGTSYRTPFEPLRVRHSDEVYASNCHKLVAILQGSARAWAVCEFFYSDLDKAWYVTRSVCANVPMFFTAQISPSLSIFKGTIGASLLKMWRNWEYRQALRSLVGSGKRFDVAFRTSPNDLRKNLLPHS
jgi:hypothetical protein